MLSFLRSLFSRRRAKPIEAVAIENFAELVGHKFAFHDDQSKALHLEIEVRRHTDGYLEVVTTRYPPAGPQRSSVMVNLNGVIAKCPDFGEQYVGRQDCLWLPPALRYVGGSGWVGMYPSQIRVLEKVQWRGLMVWRCEYKVFGNTCSMWYEESSGVKVGQDDNGYLAQSSLALPLPR